jgi:hypothetical protein
MRTFHALYALAQADLAALGLHGASSHYDNFLRYLQKHTSYPQHVGRTLFYLHRDKCPEELVAQLTEVPKWHRIGFMTLATADRLLGELLAAARTGRKRRAPVRQAVDAEQLQEAPEPRTPDAVLPGAEAEADPDYANLSAPDLLAALRARGLILRIFPGYKGRPDLEVTTTTTPFSDSIGAALTARKPELLALLAEEEASQPTPEPEPCPDEAYEPEPEPEIREAPPQMTALQRIDFHGDQVSTVKDTQTGRIYCSPREMCENMGLNWSGQYTKLTSSAFYLPHVTRLAIQTSQGMVETILLDTQYLPTWLSSISAERVHPAIKDRLLAYQRECADALHAYWTEGAAFNPRVGDTDLRVLELMSTQVSGLIQHAKQTRLIAEQAHAGVQAIRTQLEDADAEAERQHSEVAQLKTTIDGITRQLNPTPREGYNRWYTYRRSQLQYSEVYKRVDQKTLPGQNFWGLMAEERDLRHYPQQLQQLGGPLGVLIRLDHVDVYKAACERALQAIRAEKAPVQQPLFVVGGTELARRQYERMMTPEDVCHPHTGEIAHVPRAEIVHCELCIKRFWIGWLADGICGACRAGVQKAS